MDKKIKIGIVDDHRLFRNGLIALLGDFTDVEVALEAGNGNDLLNDLRKTQPEILLLDISMPGISGLELVATLRKKYSSIKIVMLSQYFDYQTIYAFMQKGVNGFLPKDAEIETIVEAFRVIKARGNYYTSEVAEALAQGAVKAEKSKFLFHATSLTQREIEVLRLICKQKTIKEIGHALCLSPRTIDTYVEKLYHKTGARKREGLVLYAAEHHLI